MHFCQGIQKSFFGNNLFSRLFHTYFGFSESLTSKGQGQTSSPNKFFCASKNFADAQKKTFQMHKQIVAQFFLCTDFFVHLQSFFLHKIFCTKIFLCICTKKIDKTLQMHFFFAFAVELSADNHENFQHHSCITKLCSISQKLCICKVFCANKNFAFAQKFLHKKNCAAAKFFVQFFLCSCKVFCTNFCAQKNLCSCKVFLFVKTLQLQSFCQILKKMLHKFCAQKKRVFREEVWL